MNYFTYRKGSLFCEQVALREIARRFGTPCYVYSCETIARHFLRLRDAWRPVDIIITYAVKANSNVAILNVFKSLGSWLDVVSGGELYRALAAGFPPGRIIFGGVGKTDAEVAYAMKQRVFAVVADSVEELATLNRQAQRARRRVNVALRINPDIDPRTHAYIATGMRIHKFGIEARRAMAAFRMARSCRGLRVVGIHHHIGSQVTRLKPFLAAFERTLALVKRLRRDGFPLRFVDIGGGIGITYKDEAVFSFEELAGKLGPLARDADIQIMMEPGRVIVGNAGILLTRVTLVKKSSGKNFIIVDAGMNDLIRPMLYGAYHEIKAERQRAATMKADVVGPICESGDFFALDRNVPRFGRGDLMAIMSAGAYGFSMSSNYNARPRSAEVLVKGKKAYLIRKRESYRDLILGEKIPRLVDRSH